MEQQMLLEAKEMYKSRLRDALVPWLVSTFDAMWRSSKRVVEFQAKLREVPGWNTAIIQKHVNAVLARTPYLLDLVAAVFLSSVKVLASVRLVDTRKDIRVKVPTAEALLHSCLERTAEEIYESIQDGRSTFQRNDKAAKARIAAAGVERSIRDLMPMGELLHAYISEEIDTERTVSPEPLFASPRAPEPSPLESHTTSHGHGHEHEPHEHEPHGERTHEPSQDDFEDHSGDGHDDDSDEARRAIDLHGKIPEQARSRDVSPEGHRRPRDVSPAASRPASPGREPKQEHVLFSDAEDDID